MKINIFWFRRDLRLHDNTGLYHALQSKLPVLAIFIFDTNILSKIPDKNDLRVNFIHTQLKEINDALLRFNSSLLIKKGDPAKIFKELIKDYDIAEIFTNHDYEPYALERDSTVKKFLESKNISFHSYKDQVIFEKQEILNQTGNPYKVYTPYKNKWIEKFSDNLTKAYPSGQTKGFHITKPLPFPPLKDIGFKDTDHYFPSPAFNNELIKKYNTQRDFPALDATSRLGIHLRFGTISIRQAIKKATLTNETWLNELIWREFFMQLLYNFPYVVNKPFNKQFKNLNWRYEEKDFQKWCKGKTGYPLVDAGMRELNQTGYMHNRVRMVTASFLTKHLLIDWRWGEKYFADKLLDYELASNNGNWQWSAGTGADAQPFFRIFNPIQQQKKFDPEFRYIKKWVPEFGTDEYPEPMVDHKFAVERAKKAFNDLKR